MLFSHKLRAALCLGALVAKASLPSSSSLPRHLLQEGPPEDGLIPSPLAQPALRGRSRYPAPRATTRRAPGGSFARRVSPAEAVHVHESSPSSPGLQPSLESAH